MKILVVCLGNICRSPIAEGILTQLSVDRGLAWEIDSAGTSGWHDGEPPDQRAIAICRNHGIEIGQQRSRRLIMEDFTNHDLILAMDDTNYSDIRSLGGAQYAGKIHRIMDFADADNGGVVPDPYFDGRFEEVFQLLSKVCRKIADRFSDQ